MYTSMSLTVSRYNQVFVRISRAGDDKERDNVRDCVIYLIL